MEDNAGYFKAAKILVFKLQRLHDSMNNKDNNNNNNNNDTSTLKLMNSSCIRNIKWKLQKLYFSAYSSLCFVIKG